MESILEELLNESHTNIDILVDKEKELNYSAYEYLEFFNNTLNNYNFNDDFSYLLDVFPIVSYLLCTSEIRKRDKAKMAEILKDIRNKIQILILQKPGDINKENPNFLLLKNLIDNTESLIVANFYDVINQYQGNSLQLIEYLLFDLKDYQLMEDVLKNYPYMIRLTDKNGITLIEKIIKKYIEEVYKYTSDKELTTNFSLIYYDKIITLFLEHEKLEFNFKNRKDAISNINYCRKNINLDEYNNQTKRKFFFWLNHLEEKLENKNHSITLKEISYMHDINLSFDEGILSEARRLNLEVKKSKYPNRMIIENEYIVTIDGEDANELDDALSIEKIEDGYYKLGIHIADPSGLLPKNSIIMDGAYEKGTSIYLPNNTVFMFPSILSKDKMNLLENKYRLATSYYLYINSNGIVENYEFYETVIKVNKNLTYNEVNNLLSHDNNDKDNCFNTLCLLSEIANKINLNFKIDEVYKLLNRTNNNSTNTNITEITNASKIVEMCMMIVNYIIPYHMNKNNLPCIYRIHTIDDEYKNKIASVMNGITKEEKNSESLIKYLNSIYPKSMYSTEAKGHFGLGLPYYSHSTAPLRRYIDNAMKLYVLDPFYFHNVTDKEAYLIEQKQKEICTHINEKNIIIDSFLESYSKEKTKTLTKN